jgi:hypothetical protein
MAHVWRSPSYHSLQNSKHSTIGRLMIMILSKTWLFLAAISRSASFLSWTIDAHVFMHPDIALRNKLRAAVLAICLHSAFLDAYFSLYENMGKK